MEIPGWQAKLHEFYLLNIAQGETPHQVLMKALRSEHHSVAL